MPKLLRKILGLMLLITTIGLVTCQSVSKAAIDLVPLASPSQP